MVAAGSSAGIPNERIEHHANSLQTWRALVELADQLGAIDTLVMTMLGQYSGTHAADELAAWSASTGLQDILIGLVAEVSQRFTDVMSADPPFLYTPTSALSSALRDVGPLLARPETRRHVSPRPDIDIEQYVQRAELRLEMR